MDESEESYLGLKQDGPGTFTETPVHETPVKVPAPSTKPRKTTKPSTLTAR